MVVLDLGTGRRPKHPARDDRSALWSQTGSDDVLSDFVKSSRPWTAERAPVPGRLRSALWALIPVELCWVIWLDTIVSGGSLCDGLICMVVTLNHHAAALLGCGASCVAGLAGLIPTTRGFARCNGIEITGLTIASAAGGASLLGIAALIISALLALAVLTTVVLAFTATSRREIEDARPRTPFPIAVPRGGDAAPARRAEPSS
jgi:hypothetical protein